MTIYFDLDGVLADFEGYIRKNDIFYVPHETRDKAADERMWDEIKKVDRFYFQLEPMKGSLELFRRLSEKYRCEILSAIPKPHWGIVGAEEDKREWVAKYLGEDVKVNIVYREQKKDFAKGTQSVLVDDYEKNIRAWEEFGGTGILFRSAEDFDESVIEKLL